MTTSYILNDLTAGKNYKVAVIAKLNGKWVYDVSNAITVTPKAEAAPAPTYPVITSQVSGRQFKLTWTAVKGAQAYGVAYYTENGWKVIKGDISANTLSYISPANNTPTGTYYVSVCAKVNGKWDTSNIKKSAVKVTIG